MHGAVDHSTEVAEAYMHMHALGARQPALQGCATPQAQMQPLQGEHDVPHWSGAPHALLQVGAQPSHSPVTHDLPIWFAPPQAQLQSG